MNFEDKDFAIGGICLAIGGLIGSIVTYVVNKKNTEKYINNLTRELRNTYEKEIEKMKDDLKAINNQQWYQMEDNNDTEEENFLEVEETTGFPTHDDEPEEEMHENAFNRQSEEPTGPLLYNKYKHASIHDIGEYDDEEYEEDDNLLEVDHDDYENVDAEEVDDDEEYEEENDDPIIISKEEYNTEEEEYERGTLYYYSEDGSLTDADDVDSVIMDQNQILGIIGEDALNTLATINNGQCIYVKTPVSYSKYKVIKVRGTFEDQLQEEPEEIETKAKPKTKNKRSSKQ